ncbi:MAG: DUF3105 domain-containing protein [Nocardioidaceae bacterium]|nr:DUF3105 domain-containing protein [Nocardioidaceae bacterium]MCL2613063.1 DUF3105 domain-containing protein [Nocardioidaceae bacterium]
MAKPKKSDRTDRQKVIDDIRRKQRRAGNRQGTVIVTICVIVAVVIIGAAAYKPIKGWIDNQKYRGKSLDQIGAAASVCKPVVTRTATAAQQHVPEGTTVTYDDAPPAFGKHWNVPGIAPAPIDQRFYTASDTLPLEVLVHNLEHGFTILWYDDTAAKNSTFMDQIQAIAKDLDANDTNNRLSFKAVPWTSKDIQQIKGHKTFPAGEHIAFSHWTAGGNNKSLGVWQYCSAPSGAALADFMNKYPYTDAPEPIGGAAMSQ